MWSRVRIAVCVACVAVVSVACVPPTGGGGGSGGPAQCPQRSRTVLQTDPVADRHTPRAFSPDGQWLVSSTTDTEALELQLTVRRTDRSEAPVRVAHKLVTEQYTPAIRRIVVSTGGDVSFIGQLVGSSAPALWTWVRSTGELVPGVEPTVAPPVGRTVQSLDARNLSEDGSRAVWVERSVPIDDPEGDLLERSILVDATTGAVIGVIEGDASFGISPDATMAIHDTEVVDLRTGQRESLEAARAAILADGVQNVDMAFGRLSDGGRYVAWSGFRSVTSVGGTQHVWRVYRWDRAEQQLVRNPSMGSTRRAYLVSSDGRVLYRRTEGFGNTDNSLREWNPDTGTDVTIDSGLLTQGGDVQSPWGLSGAPATSDLRHVAGTWLAFVPAETGILRIARCN